MSSTRCGCVPPGHDTSCPEAVIRAARCALFAGLFDDTTDDRWPTTPRVRLLDPGYRGDDPACRRFALIETD
jgi:hypothetical protein